MHLFYDTHANEKQRATVKMCCYSHLLQLFIAITLKNMLKIQQFFIMFCSQIKVSVLVSEKKTNTPVGIA